MPEETKKITKHNFYFETSLYEKVKINTLSEDIFNWEIDAYSSVNKIDTTYEIINIINQLIINNSEVIFYDDMLAPIDNPTNFIWYIKINLNCKRKDNDNIVFYILVEDDYVMKIWQFPSLADIQFAEIWKKYDKILDKKDLTNYKRAIWIFSHWFWIGSFVYLRRIFENLIFNTFNDNKDILKITEKDFKSKRMSEKVEFLKDYLPEEFSDFSNIYVILSKWVHELSEEDCLKYFEILKISIELILDEMIEMRNKQDRKDMVKNRLKSINIEIK